MKNIHTSRCIIRPIENTDLNAIAKAVDSPEFPAKLPLKEIVKKGNLENWFNTVIQEEGKNNHTWAIDLINGEKSIGQISIYRNKIKAVAEGLDERKWSLSYWLNPLFWNNGFITESLKEVIRYCFTNIRIQVLWAGVSTWNDKSIQVLEKCYFIRIGTNSKGFYINEMPQEIYEYELTQDNWLAQNGHK